MTELTSPQFLHHGTAMDVEGDKILPAKEHGKGSYWGDTGKSHGEPSQDFAWAVPEENRAWEFALDRAENHVGPSDAAPPRARVYRVRANADQSPGNDWSIPGEVKAPHFDIEQRIDVMPDRQGTFPSVNWNEHVAKKDGTRTFLPLGEDANHPSPLSEQFGHSIGRWGEVAPKMLANDAAKEHDQVTASRARSTKSKWSNQDTPMTIPKGVKR